MSSNLRTLTCPSCGREIQVPEELETFSCVYCGAKHTLADLLSPKLQSDEPPVDPAEVEAHLLDCIRNYPEYFRKFSRKTYAESFRTYRDGIEQTFRDMDACIQYRAKDRQAALEHFVDRFLADWESFHMQDKRWKHRTSRERMLFDSKLTLAWYTVPAILDLGLANGRDFTELLQKRFVEKYPMNIFQCGTYEEISRDFQRRKLCFITTAVCEFEGKPDDCAELEAFRAFRDGWLSETGQGRAQIEEYYDVAPALVRAIDYCDDRAARYGALRRDYLMPCYEALLRGDNELCRRTYTDMVRSLRDRYHI